MATGSDRIDSLVKADHDKVKDMYSEYKGSSGNTEKKQELAYRMVRELSMHASKEEEVLYPVISKAMGDAERTHLLDEHSALKKLCAKLADMKADRDESAFDSQVESVMQEFLQHVKEEENDELPRLVKMEGVDPYDLGRKFDEAADHAVTRPHTWAPDREPLNWVANRATAPLDQAADAIQGRNFDDKDKM
jgi:hemerythrin superfamily protein